MLKIVAMAHLLAKLHIDSLSKPNITIVDATCGLGNDTVYLANLVKNNGHVYAYDIQSEAVIATENIVKANKLENVTIYQQSHVNINEEVIDLVIFNLGYLPNHNKSITTKAETTLEAIQNLIIKIDNNPSMLIIIVLYPGHEEGLKESKLVDDYCYKLSSSKYLVCKYLNYNRPDSPYLLTISINNKN